MWFARFPWHAQVATALAQGQGGADLFRSEDGNEGCVYLQQADLLQVLPPGASPVRLRLLLEVPGAGAGQHSLWHYIVATDVLPEHEADFNAWYDEEHLPGLAAVPGTARAMRYIATEGAGPRYHACYDLADRSAFNSPPWLAVRATAWSSRVRPSFRNTLRTMYRRVVTSAMPVTT